MTTEHVWKLDENGNVDEWASDGTYGHGGPECALCGVTPCFCCTRHTKTAGGGCEPKFEYSDPEDWAAMVEQLRRYDALALKRDVAMIAVRGDLARAQQAVKGVDGAIKWANLHRIQADERVACIEHEAAKLRTRVAELEAQLAQCRIEEHTHAEK